MAQAQFNYSFTNVHHTSSTYTDISATGSAITMTNLESGSSTAPINIGFNFNFNGTTFTECMIHADGILRFGNAAPGSHTVLFADNATLSNSVYTNADASYQNVVFALFMDLVQGSATPTYHVLTEGVAPNRITTIQWKNLKDNNSAGPILRSQFDALEFQVKLYETTNDIQILYGNFVPSTNLVAERIAQVGIKANSTTFISNMRIDGTPFDHTEFFDLPVHSVITQSRFGLRKLMPPPQGFGFVFLGQRNTDINIAQVHTDSKVAKSTAGKSSVRIKNEGTTAVNNIDVTLELSGANVFTQTINIAALAAGADQIIDFSGYALPNVGVQDLKFSVTTLGDESILNNTSTTSQKVTNGFVQIGQDGKITNSAVGFHTALVDLAVKMLGSGTRKITQIRLPFNSYQQSIILKVMEDDGAANGPGTVLLTASARLTSADNETLYIFTTPITVTGDYFISVKQTATTNMAWHCEMQYPLQPNRVYISSGSTYATAGLDRPFLPIIRVVEQNTATDVGVVGIANPICGYGVAEPVTISVANNTTVTHDFAINPVTVSGSITNQKTNVTIPFLVIQNTGTLLAGQAIAVPTGINYDMSDRTTHKFLASTQMLGDTENDNDSLAYVIVNNIKTIKSPSVAVCPLTPVTLTEVAGFYKNIKWDVKGAITNGQTLTFSPTVTTFVRVSGLDYRGCTITDSVEVVVSQIGLPVKPLIMTADSVLSYRNGFKNTLTVSALADHTVHWIGSGTVTNGGLSYEVTGFKSVSPENHSAYYKKNSITCAGNVATKTTRFGVGILLNNSTDETISDTTFYDSGGALGVYTAGANFTKTFYPQVAGDMLKLAIYNISLGQFSRLEVYDGINNSAQQIGRLTNSSPNALSEYMASNTAGAITISFAASGSNGLGWLAGITSEKPMQYRSVQNGNFADVGSWESKLSATPNYAAATRRPFKGDDEILILHELTLPTSSDVFLDQTVVETTGTLIVPTNSTLKLYTDLPSNELTVKGILTVNGYLSGAFSAGSNGRIALSGTLNLSGAIETDSVIVTSSASPAIINTTGSARINTLIVNNATGLNLNGNLDIRNKLDLQNGIVNISNANYLRLQSGYGGTIINGSALSYVNGKLRRQEFRTSDSISFPVGKPGIYRKIALLANHNSEDFAVEYEAELLATPPTARTLPPIITNVNQQWYHRVTIVNGANRFDNATATINYAATDGVTNPSSLRVAKDDGGVNWVDLAGVATGTPSGKITSVSFTTLGDFALANVNAAVLPVNLISFKARLMNNNVQLNWQVGNEDNIQRYEIERSNDGVSFDKIGFISALGGKSLISYNHKDALKTTGVYYYRLKMVDGDGTFKYSDLVSVNCKSIVASELIRISPNPFVNQVTVQFQADKAGAVELQLTDVVGRKLKSKRYSVYAGSNELIFATGDLPKAVYLLKVITDEKVWVEKILSK